MADTSTLQAAVGTDWLPDWLGKQARTRPSHPALVHHDETLSYQQLASVALGISKLLAEHKIHRGDRVAVLARHGLSYAKAVHGIIQAGAILVPLNTRLTAKELGWQLNNVTASLLISDEEHMRLANSAVAEVAKFQSVTEQAIPVWEFRRDGVLGGYQQPNPDNQAWTGRIFLSETHAIVHTSGTTGYPKGVQITFGNHFWSASASALQLGLDPHERWLVPMPLFHVGGLAVLMRSLIYGTTAVLHDTFVASAVNNAIAHEGITLLSVVPTMLQRMLEDAERPPVGSQLRCVLLGGSGASKQLLTRCQDVGLPVAQSYGLTEANSQVATLRSEDAIRKLGSSGQPVFPTAVKVMGQGDEVPTGVAGEVWIHGPTVTPGYWNLPETNDQVFTDGWFQTGDIGYLDDEGYLYVLDRRKDLIVSGGENVYPAEIEKVLESHPDVREAGVVPLEDPEWGHVPVGFVVATNTMTLSEQMLDSYCRGRLAGYKVPKQWRFVAELPRTASGKLLRRQLIEWLDTQ